jgi:hypothetical protein
MQGLTGMSEWMSVDARGVITAEKKKERGASFLLNNELPVSGQRWR